MHAKQINIIRHGAIVLFIGLLAGFGLLISLIGGLELFPGFIVDFGIFGDTGAWARAHAGGILNGIMMFAVAVVAHHLRVPESTNAHIHWMLVGTGYANTLFYWGAILSPSRALTAGDNRLGDSNIFGILGYVPALVFAFVAMVAMIMIARHASTSVASKN